MAFIDSMKEKVSRVREREAKLEEQARARIPVKYQDFLLLLDQNQKISDKKIDPEQLGQGVWSTDKGTYIPVRLPYVTVDGRVQMAIDEHRAEGKKLGVLFVTEYV